MTRWLSDALQPGKEDRPKGQVQSFRFRDVPEKAKLISSDRNQMGLPGAGDGKGRLQREFWGVTGR